VKHELFGINRFDEKAVILFLLLFGFAEFLLGVYKNAKRNRNDYLAEWVSFFQLTVLVQPAILLLVAFIGRTLFPQAEGLYANIGGGYQFLILLLIEDMPQYWWHRLSHHSPFLWKFHYAHHAIARDGCRGGFPKQCIVLLFYA
jgi:sterol desaturase/sphingolipid hydroxylase (fatty acid hydroxylase superfamily)